MGIRIQFGDTLNDGSTNVCCQHYLDNNNKKMFRYWLCVDNVFPPPNYLGKIVFTVNVLQIQKHSSRRKRDRHEPKDKTCDKLPVHCRL